LPLQSCRSAVARGRQSEMRREARGQVCRRAEARAPRDFRDAKIGGGGQLGREVQAMALEIIGESLAHAGLEQPGEIGGRQVAGLCGLGQGERARGVGVDERDGAFEPGERVAASRRRGGVGCDRLAVFGDEGEDEVEQLRGGPLA
jgi:hypothetical protein